LSIGFGIQTVIDIIWLVVHSSVWRRGTGYDSGNKSWVRYITVYSSFVLLFNRLITAWFLFELTRFKMEIPDAEEAELLRQSLRTKGLFHDPDFSDSQIVDKN
jgi:hypothetical protein